MRFSPSFLEEIRARLPVSEVVRRRIKLQKAGREWKGLSPFGQERTPSFFVNDQKMAWFDFSCGKNGNIFDFVMETEGLTFPETVERLAQEAGLPMPARTPESERQEQRRASLHEVLEWTAAFFEKELAGPRGGKARDYLDGRGVAPASRSTFRIGYAPAEKHALRDALAARGASVETMCEAGLLIHGADIPVPYDRFRDRVIFPIGDRSGRVIAFGGRALEKDVQAKYLNSPETPVFHKGRTLFNHHRARKAAHDAGRLIVVEGYIDVVAMHAAGFPETVATSGTALTDDQIGLLWQMAPEPVLCFDGDKAGRKAAYRAADLALPLIGPSKTFSFALLPEGQDPDDLIRSSGAAAMRTLLAAPMPLVDILWNRETETRIMTTPEQKGALRADLRAIANSIKDPDLRQLYREEFEERLRTRTSIAGGNINQRSASRYTPGRVSKLQERQGYLSRGPLEPSRSLITSSQFKSDGSWSARETMIMAILLAHPSLAADSAEILATLEFATVELSLVRDRLLEFVHDASAFSGGAEAAALLKAQLNQEGFAETLDRIDKSDASARWYAQADASELDAAQVLRQSLALHHEAHALNLALRQARDAFVRDQSEASLAHLRDIQEQRSALYGKEAAIEGFGASSGRASASV